MTERLHRISNPWLRIPLKVLMWVVVTLVALIIVIPIALYIPTVQTFVKNIACDVVKEKTGMDVGIDRFRLKFPLDISLQGVKVIEARGDTMIRANEAVVDVRLLPLLKMDVQVKNLKLLDGYYKMVSTDSSMIMKIRAGLLDVAPGANVNIKSGKIMLGDALLKNGDISLYMDVWKKKPSPDTTSTPFIIQANRLKVENIRFAMSMLPTIDTLQLHTKNLLLERANINLATSNITAANLHISNGAFKYITPTPEYVKNHPAPIDTVSPPSQPMKIGAGRIVIDRFSVLYAIKGAKPLPGFDASYVQLNDVGVALRNFYNESATVVAPIDSLSAKERCGLTIISGSGIFGIDSTGMSLKNIKIRTPFSNMAVDADIPYALMALEPDAPLNARADISLGLPDINSFMPAMSKFTKPFAGHSPLKLKMAAYGTLSSVRIPELNASLPGIFSLTASGYANNALNLKRLKGALDIDGKVINPHPVEKLTGSLGVELPPFHLKGKAAANMQNYTADLTLTTPHGNLAAKGGVNITAESYKANLTVNEINVANFVPDMGIGKVSLRLNADGAGFNPARQGASTNIDLYASSIEYKGNNLKDISLSANLHNGDYTLTGNSPNENLNFDIDLAGHVADDDYSAQGYVHLSKIDLMALGLSHETNTGSADLYIDVDAKPERWLYDADLKVRNLTWALGTQKFNLPDGLTATLQSTPENVFCHIDSQQTYLDFTARQNLEKLISDFSSVSKLLNAQIEHRSIDMGSIQHLLPDFNLKFNASGSGMLAEFLTPSNMRLDTIWADFKNDSLFHGDAHLLSLSGSNFKTDTISLNLFQRGRLLNYKAHMGNRPGTLDEFAKVDLSGYLGDNRLSAYLNQQDIEGATGYRLGFTAALQDSTVSLHLTPLKSMIAYMPWTMNSDNYLDFDLATHQINANLKASSESSSILAKTEPSDKGGNDLHINLTNIRVQDFLKMSIFAPPLTATVSSDIRLHYGDKQLSGNGTLDVTDFTYNKVNVGNLGLTLDAGLNFAGDSQMTLGLKVDNQENALALEAILNRDNFMPKTATLKLQKFPLSIANAFIGRDVASLSGSLNGEMDMSGDISSPLLNGSIDFDNADIFVAMMGSSLHIKDNPITITDNVLSLKKFDIFGANNNPLSINGEVNARKLTDIKFDIKANADNFQLINNDSRAKSDLYGKVFLNLNASASGSTQMMDVNGNITLLGNTDVTYSVPLGTQQNLVTTENDVVKFVNLNDTTQVARKDSVGQSMLMKLRASLTMNPGMQVTVAGISSNATDKVELSPSGTLNFLQNYMGDMTLNGQLFIGNGFARYSLPVMGQKKFDFNPQSNVTFNGAMMNPTLNIKATDAIKATVTQGGNTRQVNFLIGLSITGQLERPSLVFDLSTDDDLSLQNELQSMSADQRQQQAMTLLITGRYSGQDIKTASSSMGDMALNNVYSYATSLLNQWAAKAIRGVDLSFGVDQYDTSTNGEATSTTSYSYQLSKSLFNNRFKINVGGNYSTDDSADENLTQNLISDISFEYMIKQTSTQSMYVRLFRHTGFENILEGEITETGVGFVMKRRLQSLRGLFRFGHKKRKTAIDSLRLGSYGNGSSAVSTDSMPESEKKGGME